MRCRDLAALRAARAPGRPLLSMALLLTLLAMLHAPAAGQAADARAPVSEERVVEGRVLRATGAEPRPLQGIWVVLHRVASDWSAPLDSVRSGPAGAYRMRYRAVGDENAIYFVSADYAGIAYFSTPLREPEVRGEAAEIYVFDTTSTTVPVRVLGRHLIVTAPRTDGHREIVEVYELANDTTVTQVSGGTGLPTFTAILPPAAEEFTAGQGDFSPGALRAENGRMVSHAPIAPGLKQLSFSYVLPPEAFPLSIPLERGVEVMEVLLEEPAAEASAAGLVEVNPVTVEQRPFRRFLAQQLPANAVLTIATPGATQRPLGTSQIVVFALLIVGAMIAALAIAHAARRRSAPVAAVAPASPPAATSEQLALAIAELDERFERRGDVSDAERQQYLAEREALKRRLAGALAAGGKRS